MKDEFKEKAVSEFVRLKYVFFKDIFFSWCRWWGK